MVKVSLIIPVYNAEKYLRETLKCIKRQKLKEIEVILINDGSTDKSGEICDEFAKEDSRITVVHRENSGMCVSRNYGMSIAGGEYIAFADNDDILTDDFLSVNYEYAKQTGADIVKFGRRTNYLNDKNEELGGDTRAYKNRIFKGKEIVENYFKLQAKGVMTAVWDGLYKRELVEKSKVKFYEDFRYGMEDTIFCRQLIGSTKVLALHEGCYYYHYVRSAYSASSKFNEKALDKYKTACILEKKIWKELKIDNQNNGQKEIELAKDYLIPVLFMLADQNCSYSYKKKKQYLDMLHDMDCFKMNLNLKKIRNMMKINRKQAGISILFSCKQYYLLLKIGEKYLKIVLKNRMKDKEGTI